MERTSAKNCAAQSGPHVNSAVPGHLMAGSLSERCVVSHSDISEAPAGTTRPTRAMRRSPSLLGHPRGKHVAYIKRKRKQSHQEMRHTPGQMNEAGAKGTRHTARPQIRCFVELSRPWSGDDMQDSSLFMSVNLWPRGVPYRSLRSKSQNLAMRGADALQRTREALIFISRKSAR